MWWNRPTIEGGSRARHTTLTFSAADLEALGTERYEHPDPRVQQRMEVLWLISQGETQARSGPLAGVSKATAARYIAIFRRHGVAGLKACPWVRPVGALEAHPDDPGGRVPRAATPHRRRSRRADRDVDRCATEGDAGARVPQKSLGLIHEPIAGVASSNSWCPLLLETSP